MKIITTLSLFFILAVPCSVFGQMFSVGDTEERTPARLQSYSTIGLSWELGDFDFTGSLDPQTGPENPAQTNSRSDFEDSILRFRFENPGINLSLGLGGSLTGMDDQSYVNINALLYNDFPLIRNQRFVLGLPLQIGTDLKSVQSSQTDNGFQQSSFVLGTGASVRYQINRRVGMSLRATPNIGFSFSQGNLFGGSLFRAMSEARFYFREVLGSQSLVFGYDFDFRDYNIEGSQNDYRYLSHAITIGIAF